MEENESLVIETVPAGWRFWTIAKLAFAAFWCVGWYWQGGGRFSPFVLMGLAVGVSMFAFGADHVYTTFCLRIAAGTVVAERRCFLRPRTWTCALTDFRIGPIDVVDDGDGPGLGAHRFIALHLAGQVVRFMEGHPEESLEPVRARIVRWLGQARPAA